MEGTLARTSETSYDIVRYATIRNYLTIGLLIGLPDF